MASIAAVLRAGPAPSKRLTLIACILGSGIVFLDGTVVNVALPAIRQGLNAGLAEQQWVVAAYLLTLSALILMGGSFGDLFGRRRVFAAGVSAFGVCSVLCAVAPSGGFLVVARALQGIAGAMLVPNTLALIMDTFSEDERGAAIGSWTAWTAIATIVGPLGGGVLIGIASWRWVFAINVVPVLFTLWLLRYAPPGERVNVRVDVLGALLAALGLAGPVFALIEQPQHGWSSPVVFVPLIAARTSRCCRSSSSRAATSRWGTSPPWRFMPGWARPPSCSPSSYRRRPATPRSRPGCRSCRSPLSRSRCRAASVRSPTG
jgi:MFS family permease